MSDTPDNGKSQPQRDTTSPAETAAAPQRDPVRRWTRIVLGVCIALFAWYVIADRLTPYTDQARVRAYIVQIAPKVSGTVKEVRVGINQIVEAEELLLQIDPADYELAVQQAEVDLEAAGQETGASTNAVAAAEAKLAEALTELEYYEKQAARYDKLGQTGAVSQVAADRTRSSMLEARSRVSSTRADLAKARDELGKEGEDNVRIRAAITALTKARLDLSRTSVRAPSRGVVTNARIDVGQYAQAGQPLMSFISVRDVWIEAFLRENSLGNVKEGDRVSIALDSAPGRVFAGEVAGLTYAVQWSQPESPGGLPTVTAPGGWLRDAQRFPVLIRFVDEVPPGLRREGGQVDVIIRTEASNWIFDALAWIWIRLVSLLSFVY